MNIQIITLLCCLFYIAFAGSPSYSIESSSHQYISSIYGEHSSLSLGESSVSSTEELLTSVPPSTTEASLISGSSTMTLSSMSIESSKTTESPIVTVPSSATETSITTELPTTTTSRTSTTSTSRSTSTPRTTSSSTTTTSQPSSEPDFCLECQSIWSSGKEPSSLDCDPKKFEKHTIVAVYKNPKKTVTGACVGHLPNGPMSKLFESFNIV